MYQEFDLNFYCVQLKPRNTSMQNKFGKTDNCLDFFFFFFFVEHFLEGEKIKRLILSVLGVFQYLSRDQHGHLLVFIILVQRNPWAVDAII